MTDLSACKTQAEVLEWLKKHAQDDYDYQEEHQEALTRMSEIDTADTLKAVIAEDSDNFQRGRLAGLEEATRGVDEMSTMAGMVPKADVLVRLLALSSKGGR